MMSLCPPRQKPGKSPLTFYYDLLKILCNCLAKVSRFDVIAKAQPWFTLASTFILEEHQLFRPAKVYAE